MAEKLPICIYGNDKKELQPGDTLPSSGSGLPDTFTGTAGEALSQYDVVYANSADSGELWIATNDGTAVQADAIGIVTESGGISDTATGEITRLGPITNAGWSWTPGATLWLGVDGAITETMPGAGNYAKPIGYAETATKIWFAPQNGWLVGFDVELSEVPPGHTGRIELVSSSQVEWTGYKYPGWDATKGRDIEIIPASTPVLNYDDNDIDGNPLVTGYPYDLFLETVSATSAIIKAKKFTNATTRAVTPALWHGRERYDNTTDAGKKRLWIGTVYLDTGPVFAKSNDNMYIWNKYNQKEYYIGKDNPYTSLTSYQCGTSWVGWNNSTTTFRFNVCLGESTHLRILAKAVAQCTDINNDQGVGIALDNTTPVNNASKTQFVRSTGNVVGYAEAVYSADTSAGFHYFLPIQGSSVGTGYIYFYSTGKCALVEGRIMC